MNQTLRICAYLLPLLAILYVSVYGVNVLYWDEFEFVDMMEGRGDFWKYVFAPHNVHIMPVGKLVYYAIACLTGMSSKAMMYLNVIILSIPYLCLVRRIRTDNVCLAAAAAAIYFTAFFSPRSCVNLLWGFQPTYLAAYSFSILAILSCSSFLSTRNARHLAAASLCCSVASLCSAHGILSWSSVFLVMLYSREYRKCLIALLPGLLAVLYYAAALPPHVSGGSGSDFSIILIVRYFLTFLSGHLLFNARAGWVTGFAALAATGFLILRKKAGRDFLFVALVSYGILVAASVTFGRWPFGLEESLTSRYFQLQMPLYLAFAELISLGRNQTEAADGDRAAGSFRSKSWPVLIVVLAVVSYNFARGMQATGKFHEERQRAASIMMNFESQPKVAVEHFLYPDYSRARVRHDFLKARRLNVFSSGVALPDGETGSGGRAGSPRGGAVR